MNMFQAGLLLAVPTLVKLIFGLFVVKIIALSLGADGLGRLGQFMSLLTIVSIIAGGGIGTGVVKYVAENKQNAKLQGYLGVASLITLVSVALLSTTLLIFAGRISVALFGSAEYVGEVRVLALSQIVIGISNLLLAVLNGFRRVKDFAVVNVIALVIGTPGVMFGVFYFGFSGAILGLIWMACSYGIVLIPWYPLCLKRPLLELLPRWNRCIAQQLGQFSIMQIVTVTSMPLAQIFIRNTIERNGGWTLVGYWQGVSKISDAYLQFIMVVLSAYFLPKVAETMGDRLALKKEVLSAYKTLIPLLCVSGLSIVLLREQIILLLFSRDFLPMADLFMWQMFGDLFKVIAYVAGYVAVSRAATLLYISAELLQSTLLVSTSFMFVSIRGAFSVTQAYCMTYFIYALISTSLLAYYLRRPTSK